MKDSAIVRDERTVTIENESFRWAYLFMAFGVLVVVAYRAFRQREANWDLLALVVGSGLVTSAYQSFHRVLTLRWARSVWFAVLASAVLAIVVALVTRPA